MEVILKDENPRILQNLFDKFVEHAHELENSEVIFHGNTTSSPIFASGLVEITEIVLTIGGVSAFAAISRVLKAYFLSRPGGMITIESKKNGNKIKITAERCDAAAVASALSSLARNEVESD